jgi:hypothetical protein
LMRTLPSQTPPPPSYLTNRWDNNASFLKPKPKSIEYEFALSTIFPIGFFFFFFFFF